MTNKTNLKHYCETCKIDSDFRYVSSNVATASLPEQHFYTCVLGCGRSYELRQLSTLENIARLHGTVTPK